ncbi:hypothetical protein [Pseudomonas chlororaphis]|uniref:hypothetical protein n=1 Tax=Pseudomonas chlororaphis TaxID=587753 RepID=UPI001672F933|nr:hypothetical protein [Pseudomonas chlororaphis]
MDAQVSDQQRGTALVSARCDERPEMTHLIAAGGAFLTDHGREVLGVMLAARLKINQ